MVITWPNDTESIIDQIRGVIGRDITFYVVASSTACSVCSLDPVTNTSTDPFCLTCSGLYWIPVYSGVTVSGHVTWGHSELLNWQSGGQFFDGDCRVQIKYTVANLDAVDRMKWAVVDGKQLFFLKKILRGVKQLNRILIDLKERKKDNE